MGNALPCEFLADQLFSDHHSQLFACAQRFATLAKLARRHLETMTVKGDRGRDPGFC